MPNIPSSSMSTGVFLLLGLLILRPPRSMPAGKDGFCPVRAGLFPSYDCRAWCRHDGECPREEKCCLRGCDSVCLPPSPEKPGICPLADEAPLAPCGTACTKDGQCPGAQKCCSSSRCGSVSAVTPAAAASAWP
uniref:WAP domain-containing protein n=1 Tax=Junco hyemalis TaxID=40217 RepID=A0A8C5I8I1_JUNHY